MIEIPTTTGAADPAFLTTALRSRGTIGPDTAVAEVEHEEIGVGVGIVGQLARLTFRYDGPAVGAPGSAVLKLPSHLPENRAVGDHFNFYEREGRFYEQIGGKLEVRTPECYWNHIDVGSGTFGLLLEDLGGRTMISQVAGVGPERAGEALETIGRVHGGWWSSPTLESIPWMPKLTDPVNLAAGQQYRDAWPAFVELLGDEIPDGGLSLGERLGPVFEEVMVQGAEEAPPTLCHGDFRVDNMLFDDAAEAVDRVALLDWQISYRGPAITDVAYFLCQSMEVEDRRASERDLLRRWYDAVMRAAPPTAAEDYPFETAWAQYRRAAAGTTVYPVSAAGSMDLANERGRQLAAAMTRRAFTACLDLDTAELLPP